MAWSPMVCSEDERLSQCRMYFACRLSLRATAVAKACARRAARRSMPDNLRSSPAPSSRGHPERMCKASTAKRQQHLSTTWVVQCSYLVHPRGVAGRGYGRQEAHRGPGCDATSWRSRRARPLLAGNSQTSLLSISGDYQNSTLPKS